MANICRDEARPTRGQLWGGSIWQETLRAICDLPSQRWFSDWLLTLTKVFCAFAKCMRPPCEQHGRFGLHQPWCNLVEKCLTWCGTTGAIMCHLWLPCDSLDAFWKRYSSSAEDSGPHHPTPWLSCLRGRAHQLIQTLSNKMMTSKCRISGSFLCHSDFGQHFANQVALKPWFERQKDADTHTHTWDCIFCWRFPSILALATRDVERRTCWCRPLLKVFTNENTGKICHDSNETMDQAGAQNE